MDTTKTMTARDEIVGLCETLSRAHAEKDPDAIVACYAHDAVIYDLAPPLGHHGMDRGTLADWFATWDGPITIDNSDMRLFVGDEHACAFGLNRMRGTKTDGTTVDLWFRATLVFAKSDGRWRLAHDHSSVPFYMDGSYRAAVDLTP